MSPYRMERLESATRVAVAFIEAFNRHDVTGMLQLVSEACLFEAPSPPPDGVIITGKAALTEYWSAFFRQYPQSHLKVEESIGYGTRSIVRWKCDWVDGTGEKQHIRGVDIFLVQNGLITGKLSYIKGLWK
jgi:predicted SnoaL-like aldol condensation-catalyzing enzyme